MYMVAKKFSDTRNELSVVNNLSKKVCENTKWKKVAFTYYLKILIKSTKRQLSYSLNPQWLALVLVPAL